MCVYVYKDVAGRTNLDLPTKFNGVNFKEVRTRTSHNPHLC